MKFTQSFSFVLLFLGVFSLAMNFWTNSGESKRGPSSVISAESGSAANSTPPWWITH